MRPVSTWRGQRQFGLHSAVAPESLPGAPWAAPFAAELPPWHSDTRTSRIIAAMPAGPTAGASARRAPILLLSPVFALKTHTSSSPGRAASPTETQVDEAPATRAGPRTPVHFSLTTGLAQGKIWLAPSGAPVLMPLFAQAIIPGRREV
jgi:hypothetical protein